MMKMSEFMLLNLQYLNQLWIILILIFGMMEAHLLWVISYIQQEAHNLLE